MQVYGASTAHNTLCVHSPRAKLLTRSALALSYQHHLPLAPPRRQTPIHALSYSYSQRSTKFREPRHVEKSAKMSWMDSWSRPNKSQATPAPYYLLPGGESTPYCKTCGRVIGRSCDVPLQLVASESTVADISKVHGRQTQARTRHPQSTAQVDAKVASLERLTAASRRLSLLYSRERSFLRPRATS